MAVKVLEGKRFVRFTIPEDTVKSVNRGFASAMWQSCTPVNVRGRNS